MLANYAFGHDTSSPKDIAAIHDPQSWLSAVTLRRAPSVQMKEFCEDTDSCRHAALVQYFGETPSPAAFPGGRCHSGCDACLAAAGSPPQPGDWQPLVSRCGYVCTERAELSRVTELRPMWFSNIGRCTKFWVLHFSEYNVPACCTLLI